MRRCPNCGTQYTDDTLRFCLQDGTPLVGTSPGPEWPEETETLVPMGRPSSRAVETTQVVGRPPAERPPAVRRRRIWPLILATAFGTILLLGLGAGGLWLYLTRRGGEPARARVAEANSTPAVAVNSKPSPSPVVSPSPTPSPSPTDVPRLDRTRIERDVYSAVQNWVSDTEDLDLDALMRHYADRVDYYRSGVTTLDRIRRDKQRAFSSFDSIEMRVSDFQFDVAESGQTAVAEFDKEWVFEGERTSTGKVRSRLTFRNVNGNWLITGERDLRVY